MKLPHNLPSLKITLELGSIFGCVRQVSRQTGCGGGDIQLSCVTAKESLSLCLSPSICPSLYLSLIECINAGKLCNPLPLASQKDQEGIEQASLRGKEQEKCFLKIRN